MQPITLFRMNHINFAGNRPKNHSSQNSAQLQNNAESIDSQAHAERFSARLNAGEKPVFVNVKDVQYNKGFATVDGKPFSGFVEHIGKNGDEYVMVYADGYIVGTNKNLGMTAPISLDRALSEKVFLRKGDEFSSSEEIYPLFDFWDHNTIITEKNSEQIIRFYLPEQEMDITYLKDGKPVRQEMADGREYEIDENGKRILL